jgi:hypothetical protein
MLACYGARTARKTRKKAQPLCGHDTGVNADSILACLDALSLKKLTHRLLFEQAEREGDPPRRQSMRALLFPRSGAN